MKRSWARRSRAARLEALADGPEIDAGSAPGVCVTVRVHRRGGAADPELPVRVRREVADRVDPIPNSNAISFCVKPRALRSSVAHSRMVSGSGCEAGDRLTVRPSPPNPVAPHAATPWPTGAARCRGAYCAHHGQEPRHRATRAASRRSRHHARQRSSRDRLMWRRAGCGQNCGQTAIGVLPSRAESAHFVRRGWDSNPREPCGSSGFQDRRIRPLCHPSEAMIAGSRPTRGV